MPQNLLSLTGKVALVTGASSGLGAHFAEVMAAAGAKVVLAARRTDKLEALVTQIEAKGGTTKAVALDITNLDSINAALDVAEASFGPVTVLINNAGVTVPAKLLDASEDDWDFIMNTNLKGAWRMAKAIAQRLVSHNLQGSIVNVASILGLRVGTGLSTYAISKAGVVQMTKAMALELGRNGIRVNALCPGYIKTEMNQDYFATEHGLAFVKNTPARRLGHLDELSAPLLLLASDAGSFINGVSLAVDGGHVNSSL